MNISSETLDKVTEIVRMELPKRLPASIRLRQVKSEIWMGEQNDIVHVTVFYDGERKNLRPRMLNEFDQEIKPLLMAIGIDDVVPISYTNREEVDAQVTADQGTLPGSHSA